VTRVNVRCANRGAATSVAAFFAMALMGYCLAGCASTSSRRAPADAGAALKIESLHMSAAGTMIDMRYRVLDAARASALLSSKTRPRLIDEQTGLEMAVPTTAKLGSLRQTQGVQRTGRTYFVLFVNTARIHPGSLVTAELGELRFPHLVVE